MKRERSRRSPSPDKPTPRPHKEEISKVRYYIKHDGKYVKSVGISKPFDGVESVRCTIGYSNKEDAMYTNNEKEAIYLAKYIDGAYERESSIGIINKKHI